MDSQTIIDILDTRLPPERKNVSNPYSSTLTRKERRERKRKNKERKKSQRINRRK